MKNAIKFSLKMWLITALAPPLLIAIGAFFIRLPNNDEPFTDYLFLSLAISLLLLAYTLIPLVLLIYISQKALTHNFTVKWGTVASTTAALIFICFDVIKNDSVINSLYIWLIYTSLTSFLIWIFGTRFKKA